MAKIHGGQIIARALKNEGVDTLFTLTGGHIVPILDGCLQEGIRIVDVRHEQTAAHASEAYTRLTGRIGVAAVTAGPGHRHPDGHGPGHGVDPNRPTGPVRPFGAARCRRRPNLSASPGRWEGGDSSR